MTSGGISLGRDGRRKAFAVLSVILVTVSLFVVFVPSEGNTGGEDVDRKVTYVDPSGTNQSVSVGYAGIASAEYNPVYWSSDNGKADWTAPTFTYSGEVTFYVTIDTGASSYREESTFTVVLPSGFGSESGGPEITDFNGTIKSYSYDRGSNSISINSRSSWSWGGNYHGGTIAITGSYSVELDEAFGGWVDGDGNSYDPGDILKDGITTLEAVWIQPGIYGNHYTITEKGGSCYATEPVVTERQYGVEYHTISSSDSVYGNIYVLYSDTIFWSNLESGTYRSADGSRVTMTIQGARSLSGDVVIDNIKLVASGTPGGNHGDGGSAGLFANGHMLIIGTGVTSGRDVSLSQYLQVYGGGTSGSTVNGDTHVAIFSGVYFNVIAGGHRSIVTGDTFLVMRGGIVLDTVVGGNAADSDVSGNRVEGDTNVYMLGNVRLLGDYYEEKYLGDAGVFEEYDLPLITESTILTGGSNSSLVRGDTHVYVSNDAVLWDVQGAGRRGISTVEGTAYVTVSGNAVVKHVVCGSITDGLQQSSGSGSPGADRQCVKNTDITVKGKAKVGSVFGAGYDTYYSAHWASMIDGGTIKVSIEGQCTVGYVYGGGYRGTIGTDAQPIDSISIDISGGTVLGDVFGGGRGGLDKILHQNGGGMTSTDEQTHINSRTDSTGYSKVFAHSISVTVSGGTVKGSVYGGGESVPVINRYNGQALGGYQDGVASVDADSIRVDVSGGTVEKSVYGAGKGVDVNDTVSVGGSTYHSSAFIFAMVADGKIVPIPWVSGSGGTVVDITGGQLRNYKHFASVAGPVTVDIDSAVGGNVYGGGAYGYLTGDVTVIVAAGGDVSGNVYGAGRGSSTDSEIALVKGDVSITLRGSVEGDVFGGGDLGSLAGDVSIQANGTEVSGSMYGGGSGTGGPEDAAEVFGTVSITASSSVIGGSLYGGGLGESGDSNTIATVVGSVSITVSGTDVGGDLYGGGSYGAVLPGTGGSLIITITSSDIGGNVYSGGMGEPGRLATDITDRSVTITGTYVDGSVYGGSRYGNDNCHTDGSAVTSSRNTSVIRIVSGDMAAGASGNVYGAGYMGHALMDTHVYIGTPAAEAVGVSPSGSVSIRSVYGGSSVGSASSGMLDEELLHGDTNVLIGSTGYSGFSITGDVFGSGDFCDISGESSVRFDGFSQAGSMLSVQKVDRLEVVDSKLVLDGNIDGHSTEGSPKMSLNRIGQLDLVAEDGRSELMLNAAASAISGYSSTYAGTPSPEDYNILRINSGMVFSIMGVENRGIDMGYIQGQTLIYSDSNPYYGALVMGALSAVHNDPSFWLARTVNGVITYEQTTFADYSYAGVDARVWMLDGAYKVEQTVMFESDGSSVVMTEDVQFTLPKISTSSRIMYAGYYLNPYSPDTMDLVTTPSAAGSDISVRFGMADSGETGVTTFNDRAGADMSTLSGVLFADESSSGAMMRMEVGVLGGYSSTGYMGSITIHFVEVSGNLAVNIFDVEVQVYLGVVSSMGDVDIVKTVVMRGSGRYDGTVDIYLPFLDKNEIGDYSITSISVPSGELSINAVPTNLNRDGWVSTPYRDDTYQYTDGSVMLGSGGVFSPVLRVTYANDSPDFEDITFTIRVVGETTGTVKNVDVTLEPRHVIPVEVTFSDKVLDIGSDGMWSDYQEVFTLEVDFGTAVSGYYVLVAKDWSGVKAMSAIDYVKNAEGLLLREGDTVLTATSPSILQEHNNGSYEVMSVEQFLQKYMAYKPSTQYTDVNNVEYKFVYEDNNALWYDSLDGYSRFNFDSAVSKGLVVYAGYSVGIDVEVYNPESGGNVTKSVLFSGAPGTEVDLYGQIGVTAGYEIAGWYYGNSRDDVREIPKGTDSDGNTTVPFRTYSSTTVYVELKKIDYTISVTFNGDTSGNESWSLSNGKWTFTVGEEVTINVVNLGDAHITLVTANGNSWDSFTFSADSVQFTAPAMNLEVVITLSVSHTLTVEMPVGGDHDDNELFGIAFDDDGKFLFTGSGKSVQVTDRMFIILAPKYGSNSTVLTLYDPDGKLVGQYRDEFTLDAAGLSENVTYTLYVNVLWNVTFGDGYDHEISSDHSTHAYTGDTITLTLREDYAFGSSFQAHGATLTEDGGDVRTYTVNSGSGVKTNVTFTSAERTAFIVTVVVQFNTTDGTATSRPDGGITVTPSVNFSDVTWGAGTLTYTFKAGIQSYEIAASFDGYTSGSATVQVSDNEVVTIVLSKIYSLTIQMPQDGGNHDNELFGIALGSGGLVFAGSGKTVQVTGQTLDVKAPAYGPNSTRLSLVGSDNKVIHLYSDGFTLDATGLEEDVTYYLYVNVLWNVTYGEGYTHTTSSKIEGHVLTGDTITLTIKENYEFGSSFGATGATLTEDGDQTRMYTVNTGGGKKTDVSFTDAHALTFIVTVEVTFSINGAQAADEPKGGIIVSPIVEVSGGSWSPGKLTYTFDAGIEPATYTISALYDGYQQGQKEVHVDGHETVRIELEAEAQKVQFVDNSGDPTTDWYIEDDAPVKDQYTGDVPYVAWGYEAGGQVGLLFPDSILDISMFEEGELILVILAEVQDVVESVEDLGQVSVLISQDQLAEGHSWTLYRDYTAATVVGDASVTASIESGTLTLKTSDPARTGSFQVSLEGPGHRITLLVTVVESPKDIGGVGAP